VAFTHWGRNLLQARLRAKLSWLARKLRPRANIVQPLARSRPAHHDRKMGADDVFDTVSGTLGLTGGVDTIIILQRHTKGITMNIRGRDLEDTVEKAVNFDRGTARWMILGDASDVHRLKEEQQVIDALRCGNALKVLAIKDATGIAREKLDVLLGRMVIKGLIERTGRGVYGLVLDPMTETDDAT
jgi:hypothetical protein